MAVIDASVYISLINAHEDGHDDSWAWLEQAISAQEPVVAPAAVGADGTLYLGCEYHLSSSLA